MILRTLAAAVLLAVAPAASQPIAPASPDAVQAKAPPIQPPSSWRTGHRAMIEIGAEML